MEKTKHFWHRTPPALFPSLLGLFGLALALRHLEAIWAGAGMVSGIVGLLATVMLLVTLTSYLVKLMIRPAVLWEDLKIGPARGTVSAGSMCAMAMAAFLVPYVLWGAWVIWWLGLALHAVYFLCVLVMLLRLDDPVYEISPALMLPAVGVLVAVLAAPSLGYRDFGIWILAVTIPLSAVILLVSLWNAKRHGIPAPQRSSFAIFLAPPSVAALGVYEVFGAEPYLWVWIGASFVALALLPFWRWMSLGGWNAGWGAFAFPLAAFAAVQIVAVEAGFGWVAMVMMVLSLALACVMIPFIVCRTYVSWFRGHLAENTRAAIA